MLLFWRFQIKWIYVTILDTFSHVQYFYTQINNNQMRREFFNNKLEEFICFSYNLWGRPWRWTWVWRPCLTVIPRVYSCIYYRWLQSNPSSASFPPRSGPELFHWHRQEVCHGRSADRRPQLSAANERDHCRYVETHDSPLPITSF